MRFNTRKFLTDKFTDSDGLLHFLDGYGVRGLERAAVYKWFRREQVPAKWAFLLIALLEIENGPVPILAYVETGGGA